MGKQSIFRLGSARRQQVVPSYKGGHTVVQNGYVFECFPEHPRANFWGFVQQHHLVAEDLIGRFLRPGEIVHHLDECRSNNSPENLEVMTQSEHRKLHARILAEKQKAKLSPSMVRQALRGRTIHQAAKHLGVHHQTLRNRYPDLLADRKRKPPTDIDDPDVVRLIRELASSDQWSLRRIANEHKISAKTTMLICDRHNICWVRKSKVGEVHKQYRRKNATHQE